MPMRLMPWNSLFTPEKHSNSNALILYKFPGFPIKLWSQKIVMSMGSTPGTPIHLDQSTINQEYGYHASVLVDIELSKPIPDHVLIDVEGKEIRQEVIMYRVPKYCNHCKNVGHGIAECKIIQRAFRVSEQTQVAKAKRATKEQDTRGNQAVRIQEAKTKQQGNKETTNKANKHTYFTDSLEACSTISPTIYFLEQGEWSVPKSRGNNQKEKTTAVDISNSNKFQALMGTEDILGIYDEVNSQVNMDREDERDN
ncbi:hypothetical protein GIB67_039863 [Kingdonia uniflora]|uniref:DUF4283 domain-containing protein n=1 Tax=Kingdonia uniflora TaxID=39325 RepID=A0A7J7P3S5_9MAGN|nr:hypothetical protein GIB67_039863 [Kingdonia uniflora]